MKHILLPRVLFLSFLLFGVSAARADVGDMTTLSVSAGGGHALALRSDGTVWTWGDNTYGQLGVPTVAFSEFPLRVAGLSNIVGVSAGADFSLAVQSNGKVWSWGANETGQLGTSNFTASLTPTSVVGISNVVAVSAGGYQGIGSHALALLSNGTVMAWGYNGYGEVGNEGFATCIIPVPVLGLSNVMQIRAGGIHSMALTTNGQVWCWGYGGDGEVGNGSNNYYTNATQTLNVSNMVSIGAGALHSVALKSDGTVWAWGYNADGELGLGNTNNTATATKVSALTNVTAIAAGMFSTAATLAPTALTGTNTQSYVWGYEYGTTPFALAQTAPFTQLAAGYEFYSGNDYFFGLTASGSVYAWGVNDEGEFGDGNASSPFENAATLNFDEVPTLSFTATPVSQWGEFIRGDLDDLNYCTIVVPEDLEQGVQLNATGNDQYSFTNSKPWFLSTSNQTLQLAEVSITGTTNLVTYPVANPMVAFGSQGNGSPLFVNTPYRFGVYAGGMDESITTATNVIQISVYDATKYTNGVTTNMVPTNVYTIALPERTIAAQSNSWITFMSNGASVTFSSNGLTTTVGFLDSGYTNEKPFGLTWFSTNGLAPQMTNFDLVGYQLTHTATGTNYFYKIAVLGKVQVATNKLAPMGTNSSGVWSAIPLYTLDFQQPSALQSMYVDRLFFQGTPMPPTYENATAPGPTGLTTLVTNIVSLTSSVYTNIDGSPELRRSPILDQFVTNMNKDPLALASYVINQIALTDPYAEAQSNQVIAADVNCGGIDRSAQATFLEGQGSPIEQCALLVYLLRSAGYPAAYVFPTNGNLLMTDTHISQLWQMQVNGVVNILGIPYITSSFLTVDYPWVVANIGTNTVHIFPWIKDTKIVQGVNLYDYMPPNYSTALDWVEQYVRGNSNIMSLNPENLPAVLFPAFVQQCISTNEEGASISLNDLGVTAYNRPQDFPAWSYLPQPDYVTNLNQLAIVDSLTDSATTYPFLSNMFNTAEIKVYNTTGSSSNLLIDTGVWDSCDFHDRKLLVFTNNSQICLWMAPYRTNVTTVTTFSSGAPSSTSLLSNSVAASGITNLTVNVIHKRRVAYLSQSAIYFPITETMGTTNISRCNTYEVAGIALDYGLVSSTMLQQYENFYWGLQAERAANTSFVPTVWDYQGSAAYLLAMGYYQKSDVFDALNQQWHAVRRLISFKSGLGTVGNAAQTNMQARVDMTESGETLIANGSLRPDSGVPNFTALENYYALNVVNGSAQEHDILQTMFPDQNAVSTVRLLQLAQLRATNGNSPILELYNNDYVAQGEATHAGYGSTVLSNISPQIWAIATNAFAGPDAPYCRVLLTPGLVTNVGGSFGGMGALTFSYASYVAAISSNSVIYNGGYGSILNAFTLLTAGDTLQYNLTVNPDGSLAFTYNNPSGGNVNPAPSPLDSAGLDQENITPTTSQDNEAVAVANVNGQSPPGTQQTTLFELIEAANDGFDGTAVGWPQSAGESVEDPVDPVSGGFYVDAVDLTLPGPFPLQLRRNYLSQNPSANNFGYGWKMNFMPYLVVTTNTSSQSVIYAAEMNGVVIAYHQTNTSDPWVVLPQDNPSLNNNNSVGKGGIANLFNSVLKYYNTNGGTYIISAPDGSTRTYTEMSFAVVNGTNTMNRTRPYLTLWQDHSGNYAQFLYDTTSTDTAYGQLSRINMANGNDLVFTYDFYGRIIQAFTGDGRFVTYQYDNYGDLVNVTLPDNTQCQYQYEHYNFLTTNGATVTTNIDSTHLIIQEIKPNGRIVANNYDSLNRVTNQMSTVGTNLVLVTNAYFFYTNNVTSLTNQFATGSTGVQDCFHNPTVYYYTNNQITNIVDPYGYSSKQVWYADNATAPGYPRSLQYTVDKRGLTNSYYYNSSGCVTQVVASAANLTGDGIANETATSTYTYTTQNLPSTMTDPVGNGMQFVYDSGDPFKLDQSIRTSGGTAVYTNFNFYTNVSSLSTIGTTNYAYGIVWRQVQGGATNDFFYNGQGFKTEQIQYTATMQTPNDSDPSIVTLFNYNERGQCYQQQVVGGALTQETFDAIGRTTSRQVFDQNNNNVNSEFFYYNDNGELQWYVGPRTNPVQYVYYIYDGAGRNIQQINWRSQGMVNGGGVEAPDGNNLYATTFKTFDGFGNNTSIIDPRGVVTTNQFDALGRVLQTQVIDVNGATLTTQKFSYEPGGKVTLMTNGLNGVTRILYTQTGQPYFQQNPDGSTNGWTYYLDGRIKEQVLPNGSYWLTTYNDVSLQATRTFYSGGTALSSNLEGFDERGNQTLTIDPVGNPFTNNFDGLNRLKFTAGPLMVNILTNAPLPGGSSNQTNSFQAASTNFYDAARLFLTNINILGETKITFFDVLGRQTEQAYYNLSSTLARITTISYSPDHQSETITQGSGSTAIVKTIYTDNANKPVLTISYPSSGVEEFTLDRYDAAENLISETHNTASGGTATTWTTTSLVLDGLNRITSKTDRDGAVTTYAYDAASDPTSVAVNHGPAWTASYNSAQQKLYDFDSGSGSVTRSNSYTYYSTLGLLETMTDGRGVTCIHYYDAFLRPASNVYSGPLPEHNMTVSWAYDPRNLPTNISQSFASTNTGPGVTVSRTYGMYWELIQESILGGNNYTATEAYDADIRRTGLGINNFGWGFSYQADGMMTSAGSSSLYGGAGFSYSTSGLLLSSLFSPRTTSVTQFDGDGRPLAANTTANGSTILNETLTYTPDGLLASHTVARPDFTDNRSYTYANLSRRLTQEAVGLSASSNWTTAFVYDNGVSGGPGVLTSMGQAVGTNVNWKGGTDAFSRVNAATNTVAQRQAYGYLNGTATMTALLDGNDMPVTLFGTNDNYRWQAQLSLVPGAHKLIVNALNWSGFYTASATNTFTNNALDHVQETYAGNGEVTNRVWITSGGKTNATQSLSFDAMDRLHSVTYLDTNNNGYIWNAVYDTLGRRMSTTAISVTNGIALSNLSKTIGQYYDPNVPFLELGESDSGNTVWKMYGPDVNGTYGGMQGVGGLQAVVNGPRDSSPMIYDTGGNELGIYVVSNSSTVLFPSRVTAYGAVPGYAPLPVADGALVGQSSAWRGKWPDITGFYYLGRRYYDPVAGNWLSFDPAPNAGDPNGYSFCGGDPVNNFDPMGLLSAQTESQSSSGGSYAENLAAQLGISYTPQLPGESMSDYASRLGLSGGMANSPWAIANASGSYALFSSIMNSGGVPDPDYQEVPWGGQGIINAAFNVPQINDAWNELNHPDLSSGWGIATFGVAGISFGANILNAAGNVLTLGELGVAENGITTGVKDLAESGVWDLNPFARGRSIEQTLGANLPGNFPIIDSFDFATGTATSIKSIDLTAASYQNTSALASRLNSYVDSVAGFNGETWAGVNIDASQITARQLQLAIPPGSASAAQQAVIDAVAARAQNMGVNFILTPVP
jgi:RHS repeat-associated protein